MECLQWLSMNFGNSQKQVFDFESYIDSTDYEKYPVLFSFKFMITDSELKDFIFFAPRYAAT